MILYLDTSAWVKLFVKENYSENIIQLYNDADLTVTSVVAFAECAAALRRKFREKHITENEYTKLILNLSKEYLYIAKVSISEEIDEIILALLEKYPLRGFDAIHLASALLIKNEDPLDLTFACYDVALNSFAQKEGLNVPIY